MACGSLRPGIYTQEPGGPRNVFFHSSVLYQLPEQLIWKGVQESGKSGYACVKGDTCDLSLLKMG